MEQINQEISDQITETVTNQETPQTAGSDAQPAAPAEMSDEDADAFLNKLIEAAERRGYVKARNELAKAAMASPHLWQNPLRSKQQPENPSPETGDTDFLTHITPNVWD